MSKIYSKLWKEFRIPPPAQNDTKYIPVDSSHRAESEYLGPIWRKPSLQKLWGFKVSKKGKGGPLP